MTIGESPEVRRREGVAVIDLAGDLNSSADAILDDAWSRATAEPAGAVVLNFSHTGYINSSGIALIVGLLARGRANGIPVRAFGLSAHYREIFDVTRLSDFMAVTPDEDSAVRGAEGSS